MSTSTHSGSGFSALGISAPTIDHPLDWYVWHFTHTKNLLGIAEHGALFADAHAPVVEDIGSQGHKAARRRAIVKATGYPADRSVSEHVPWYFAPRSPMLLTLVTGYGVGAHYKEGHWPLVMLGMRLGDLVETGLEWCFSDRNATSPYAQFTVDTEGLGQFIDFPLMCEYRWQDTADDSDRSVRRAAETLVHIGVPLELITQVVASNETTLSVARETLSGVNKNCEFAVRGSFLYKK